MSNCIFLPYTWHLVLEGGATAFMSALEVVLCSTRPHLIRTIPLWHIHGYVYEGSIVNSLTMVIWWDTGCWRPVKLGVWSVFVSDSLFHYIRTSKQVRLYGLLALGKIAWLCPRGLVKRGDG